MRTRPQGEFLDRWFPEIMTVLVILGVGLFALAFWLGPGEPLSPEQAKLRQDMMTAGAVVATMR